MYTMKTIIYSSVVNKHSARLNTKELYILIKLGICVFSMILPIDWPHTAFTWSSSPSSLRFFSGTN